MTLTMILTSIGAGYQQTSNEGEDEFEHSHYDAYVMNFLHLT
jgi:hypothetical protein